MCVWSRPGPTCGCVWARPRAARRDACRYGGTRGHWPTSPPGRPSVCGAVRPTAVLSSSRHGRVAADCRLLAIICGGVFAPPVRRWAWSERLRMLTIHHGRHTFISHALAGGRTLPEVRDAAGHANVSVTSCYLHVMVDEDTCVGNLFRFAGRAG